MDKTKVRVTANFRPNAMNYKHNKRDYETCIREKNVDLSQYHETIIDKGDVYTFFNELFAKSVEEYNARQKRADRRIKNNDYLSFIKAKNFKSKYKDLDSDGKIKPVTEIEFKIGKRDNQWPNRKQCRKILKEFIKEFEELYGHSVKIVGAYLHDDEYGISQDKNKDKIFNPPHLHLDIVYVGHSLTSEEIKIEDADREKFRLEKMKQMESEGKKWNETLWKKTDWTEYRVNKFGKALRNGLNEVCSMSAALAELGFRTRPKSGTAQMRFENDVHVKFQNFCEKKGINVDRTKVESHKHASPEVLAKINENKKLEREVKKQELRNKHDRKIIDEKNVFLNDREVKLENDNKKLLEDQKSLDERAKDLKDRESKISNTNAKLSLREKSVAKKEEDFRQQENIMSGFQKTFTMIKNDLTFINNIEKDAKNHFEETKNINSTIKLFSTGVRRIVSAIKYELVKYKQAFKDFFNYTPKQFRALADTMEKNGCSTFREYHDKMELGRLSNQINKSESKDVENKGYRGR